MYALELLTVSGTDAKHLNISTDEHDFIKWRRLLQEGLFKNKEFNQIFTESASQNIDSLKFLDDQDKTFEDLNQARRMAFKYINSVACKKGEDLRQILNIGTWLDEPGYIGFEDGSKQYTMSLIRAIMRMDAWASSITVNPLAQDRWPQGAEVVNEDMSQPIPYRDEQKDTCACIMIKHTEDPGFVVFMTRRLNAFEKNPTALYNALCNKLPRFGRLYNRYQGQDIYYQVIAKGDEAVCRKKSQEMLTKYVDDIRCLNFESGNW